MRSKLARYMTNLEHFATVVEYGNISAAANVLAITQPALTRSIMRIEEVLGVQLLHRSARGVHPTDCGRALLVYIAAAESELQKAHAMIQVMKGVTEGRINCGAGSVTMNHIIPEAVSGMLKRHGRIHINLIEGRTQDLLLKLRSGELDLVVGIEQPDALFTEFHSEKLIQEHYHFCVRAAPENPLRHIDTLQEVVRQDKLVLPVLAGTPVDGALESELARVGGVVNEHRVETMSYAVMRHLLLSDGYIAFCSSILFGAEIRSGSIAALQGDWRFPSFMTRVFRRRDEVVPKPLQNFIDEIHRAATEYDAGMLRPE